jgi:hypothetical protein
MQCSGCHYKETKFRRLAIVWLSAGTMFCFLFLLSGCSKPLDQGIVFKRDKPLEYLKDRFGNQIPDYSTAGYKHTEALPQVPVVLTLSPGKPDTDDTARIQKALDELGQLPADTQGFRGALLLTRGSYKISGQLKMNHSGVVLRGEGQFAGGTILRATGVLQRSLIILHGDDREQDQFEREMNDKFYYRPENEESWEVVDEFVPSGGHVLQISPVKGLGPGDTVILEQRMNEEWVKALGMNEIPARSANQVSQRWDPTDFVFQFERKIDKTEGGRVHLSAPLVNPVFARFGTTRLFKPMLPKRVKQSGVEGLRLISDYRKSAAKDDEAHAWIGVEVSRARDCWVKSVTAVHFAHSTVKAGKEAIGITVENCAYLEPISRFGYGRRHGFSIEGQQILVQRCFVEDGAFPFFTPEQTCGPNVFLDCYASGEKNTIGPWRYWVMGTLWDNVCGERFTIRNRGNEGDNWGWSGINNLFWNCEAFDSISVQSPVNGWNWAIGCRGRRIATPFQGLPGNVSSHGKPIEPRSLFLKQLEDRTDNINASKVANANQATGSVIFQIRENLAEN